MNDELFNLCNEVYRRTSWFGTNQQYLLTNSGQYMVVDGNGKPYKSEKGLTNIPLYTSDCILEKLPVGISLNSYHEDVKEWVAALTNGYRGVIKTAHADTPLKALLKLVIALDDAGVKL